MCIFLWTTSTVSHKPFPTYFRQLNKRELPLEYKSNFVLIHFIPTFRDCHLFSSYFSLNFTKLNDCCILFEINKSYWMFYCPLLYSWVWERVAKRQIFKFSERDKGTLRWFMRKSVPDIWWNVFRSWRLGKLISLRHAYGHLIFLMDTSWPKKIKQKSPSDKVLN